MKKKSIWDRLFAIFDMIHLVVALIVGVAGAFVLGSFFGMGMGGYALGFVLGVGITLGGITIG